MFTHVYGLIGYPLSHSFSRPHFTEFFAREGLSDTHVYLNFEMEDIAAFKELSAVHPTIRGANVTIPHKESVIPLLDRLDPAAERIGAVNCIRFEEDGTTTGFNTDYLGFRNDLRHQLHRANWAAHQLPSESGPPSLKAALSRSRALVLGTGGASLAIHEALNSLGVRTTRVSRRAGTDRITYEAITTEILDQHRLIVNTTPLGMKPNAQTYPEIPYQALTDKHFVYDCVYNPATTEFMRRSMAAGAGAANGLGMLHGQARAGWAIWSGKDQTKN